MKIYLAGAFAPYEVGGKRFDDWRDFVIQEIGENKDKKFYDPRRNSRQICPATFTLDDAFGVLESDCLLHYRTRGYEDEGASWEQGIAFATNLINKNRNSGYVSKLIICVDDTNLVLPLNFSSADINFSNLPTAVRFLKKIKSTQKQDWISIFNELVNEDRGGV